MENSVGITGNLTKLRTQYSPNSSLEYCRLPAYWLWYNVCEKVS
jgi:hypothetical protein